ncbi:MAG: 2-C-methyl-D-erythritol 2,4-cyclodiphosphate synthase [Muribaculaceae bacterium]|nr:2-C-methyl-D-erythritol 2,4-cyclodiphosphate synthase [Muribaculaceae bacterium]MDE5957742.1 2-C-methyl-D-erythritol 2,4-cyclodiphosphate synthase [Muribaculaceae bacterium]MDE7343391.1 2-C-methyl-D-erythritol 2,4-cyclodiphosphate synthase [Muribaculaceae bacterium]
MDCNFRIGSGFDVHRLVEGRDLWLCGLRIDHHLGLLGHSDADVAIHALCDALLGALALGDIGKLFPDSDPRYKGIDSKILLSHVVAEVHRMGWKIGNADITILAERPKLRPHIDRMRDCLAELLDIPADRTSVKATTTEGLGYTGRQEGIAAQASVLIYR